MNELHARDLVMQLVAAFPTPVMPEATFAVYVAELGHLKDVAAAQEAITTLVRSVRWLPSIAEIRDTYRPKAQRTAERRARERGLAEPPADPDNAARARELLARLVRQSQGIA